MDDDYEQKIRFGVALNLAWQEAVNATPKNNMIVPEFESVIKRAFEIKDKLVTPAWNEYAFRKEQDEKKRKKEEAGKLLTL